MGQWCYNNIKASLTSNETELSNKKGRNACPALQYFYSIGKALPGELSFSFDLDKAIWWKLSTCLFLLLVTTTNGP